MLSESSPRLADMLPTSPLGAPSSHGDAPAKSSSASVDVVNDQTPVRVHALWLLCSRPLFTASSSRREPAELCARLTTQRPLWSPSTSASHLTGAPSEPPSLSGRQCRLCSPGWSSSSFSASTAITPCAARSSGNLAAWRSLFPTFVCGVHRFVSRGRSRQSDALSQCLEGQPLWTPRPQ